MSVRRSRHKLRARGFTLIEILVALAILAVALAAGVMAARPVTRTDATAILRYE